jgi:hypothetical protein
MQVDSKNNLILNIKNKTQIYSTEEVKKALEEYEKNKIATSQVSFCANHDRDTQEAINEYYGHKENKTIFGDSFPTLNNSKLVGVAKPVEEVDIIVDAVREDLLKIYLAIPYTGIEESSYNQATEATMLIINEYGHNVFSPITHSHPLAQLGVKGTWDFWQHLDYQYIDWADEVWVLIPKEGIQKCFNSTGVVAEIKYATEKNKVIKFVNNMNNKIIENYGSC